MNQYSMQSKLGQGAFATVYRVKRKEDGLDYALKKIRIMSLSEKQIANCLNEVRILASIEYPYILCYKDSFFDENSNNFCIITEYLEGGDISQLIAQHKNIHKLISQQMIWMVAIQTLKALQVLHKINILHRDIKSANIFLNKGRNLAKLGDMNVSIVSANGMAKTQTGTPYYASPQVWNEKNYDSKCDIWSLGCVLYQMATLRPPFMSPEMKTLKKSINSGIYKPLPSIYSKDLDTLIKCCLKVNPKQRSTITELLGCYSVLKKCESLKIEGQLSEKVRVLDKIEVPHRQQFRILKQKLPRNKFSNSQSHKSQKVMENKSYNWDQNNKENSCVQGSRTLRKSTHHLPVMKRSVSNVNQDKSKCKQQQKINVQRPPMPMPRSNRLRG